MNAEFRELIQVFLKLGFLGFGGPAAHISMMEDEIVRKRQWVTHQEFLDLLSATNLIPGPSSTEMALHFGWKRAGLPGMLLAGVCFIGPAVIISALLAWAYVRWGRMESVVPVLEGMKPAVVVVVAAAAWRLGKSAVTTPRLLALFLATVIASLVGLPEIVVLIAAALLGILIEKAALARGGTAALLATLTLSPLKSSAAPLLLNTTSSVITASFPAWKLGAFFLSVGTVLYGSGYVLIAFIEGWLVDTHHLLSRQQLLDAVAIGQFTPGPVSSTATVIGYIISGWTGSLFSTIGIFLPSFVFVGITQPLLPRMRQWRYSAAFLDAANAASVALIAVVAWRLGLASISNWQGIVIAVLSTLAVFLFKLNAAFVVIGGGLLGLLLHMAA